MTQENLIAFARKLKVGPGAKITSFAASLMSASKKVTLGVDIGKNDVKLVKLARVSRNRFRLLDRRLIPLDKSITPNSPRFHEFLGSCLSSVGGEDSKCDLWAQISTANLDVRCIKIPKVARAQIRNAVIWTVKKETNFDAKQSVIDFEVHAEVWDDGVAKIGVTAYILPLSDLEEIRELFSRCGQKLAGITAAPFAMQNLVRALSPPPEDKVLGVLHIGSEHSRIDIFTGGDLVLSRHIKTGIESMLEAFSEERDEEISMSPAGDIPSLLEIRDDQNPALLLGFFSNQRSSVIGEQEAFAKIRPVMVRLVKQVERTLQYYTTTLKNPRVEALCITCEAGAWEMAFDFITDQLGIEKAALDPLGEAITVSEQIYQRHPFTAATGLAMSDYATPNLLLTYADKENLQKSARINRGIFAAFLVAMVLLCGVIFRQSRVTWQKKAELALLEHQLESYDPQPNRNTLAALAARVVARRRILAQRSDCLLAPALIGELAALTPANVGLLSLKADFKAKPDTRPPATAKAGGKAAKSDFSGKVVLEGVVTGEADRLEESLAGYVLKLSGSPLFGGAVVTSNRVEQTADGEVLKFSLRLQIH
jgi:Tfp pilus assembly PilM family ATPase